MKRDPAFLLAAAFFALLSSRAALAFECKGTTPVSGDGIALERVTRTLVRPVDIAAPPGDTSRLFVAEQGGRIRIIDLGSDTLHPEPFLDITSRVVCCGERGLLGLAFHPRYAETGELFVHYTRAPGAVCAASPPPGCPGETNAESVLARYRVSEDPDAADPDSEEILLSFCQPYSNHNGGQIAFGPLDGFLHVATGDGGLGGDPCGSGQRIDTYLGKILRIDVDGGDPYGIPPDNPFVADDAALDEIWALGLRNPWRFAFDPESGDVYIGDVGQGAWEEIDYRPATEAAGANYEWNRREGDHDYDVGTALTAGTAAPPLYEYPHGSGALRGCSVTGGVVYRGCRMPDLHGTYFFADYCNDWIATLRVEGGEITGLRDRTAELNAALDPEEPFTSIVAFGTDGRGEVYIASIGGSLFRVVPAPETPPSPAFTRGDANSDGGLDISDGVITLIWLFLGSAPPPCLDAADADDSGVVELADAVFTFQYLFLGGAAPPAPGPASCGADPSPDEIDCAQPPPVPGCS